MQVWLSNRIDRLPVELADWLIPLGNELAELAQWRNAKNHLLRIERVAAATGLIAPKRLLGALRTNPDLAATATIVAEFLTRHGLATDDPAAHVHSWREHHLHRVTEPFQPAVRDFVADLVVQQRRSALYGNSGLSDRTINYRLLTLVHLADHLTGRGITDWASVNTTDIETFLTIQVPGRLATVRHFFGFARRHKLVLVDPTREIQRRQPKGYRGRLLTVAEQQTLLRRWTRSDIDSRERVVGLLCLLHAASNAEVRHLKVSDLDLEHGTVQLGQRPHLTPLDTLTVDALRAWLAQRETISTNNPHLLITHLNRLHDDRPCSIAFPASLVAKSGIRATTQILRQTRLADLAHRLDPRVVADAIGITKEAAIHYVTGSVDHEGLAFSLEHEPDTITGSTPNPSGLKHGAQD